MLNHITSFAIDLPHSSIKSATSAHSARLEFLEFEMGSMSDSWTIAFRLSAMSLSFVLAALVSQPNSRPILAHLSFSSRI